MSAATEQVQVAVQSVINSLSLTPTPTFNLKRKQPQSLDGDTYPLIIVSVGDGYPFERIALGTYLIRYPCFVAVAFKSLGQQSDDIPLRNWMDAIWPIIADWRNLITLGGLTIANDCFPHTNVIFDKTPLTDAAIDWGMFTFTVETKEQRFN
jgi:hypothetical protein